MNTYVRGGCYSGYKKNLRLSSATGSSVGQWKTLSPRRVWMQNRVKLYFTAYIRTHRCKAVLYEAHTRLLNKESYVNHFISDKEEINMKTYEKGTKQTKTFKLYISSACWFPFYIILTTVYNRGGFEYRVLEQMVGYISKRGNKHISKASVVGRIVVPSAIIQIELRVSILLILARIH